MTSKSSISFELSLHWLVKCSKRTCITTNVGFVTWA